MGVNIVKYYGSVIVDMTDATVTPDTLAEGVKAYDAKGNLITGIAKLAAKFTNLVPKSTDTDGSVYNGTGYKDNARLSSSGGVSGSAQNGSVVTGFMPYSSLGIVRIKGATWKGLTTSDGHFYINAYNASKSFLVAVAATDSLANTITAYDAGTGITTFDFTKLASSNSTRAHFANAKFIRINAKGKGADLIVTVNEEIS